MNPGRPPYITKRLLMGRKQSNHRKTKQFYAERFCLSKTCELYTTCMFFSIYLSFHSAQGTKIFKYCTCPAGRVTNNCHSFCKHKHLSFKSLCNKEHKGVICNMTSSSDSFLKKELLVLSRFHSYLRAPPPPPRLPTPTEDNTENYPRLGTYFSWSQ